jgi:hypothetical protein
MLDNRPSVIDFSIINRGGRAIPVSGGFLLVQRLRQRQRLFRLMNGGRGDRELRPRIQDCYACSNEVFLVASNKGKPAMKGCSGDERVHCRKPSSLAFKPSGEFTPNNYCGSIDIDDSVLKLDEQVLIEPCF